MLTPLNLRYRFYWWLSPLLLLPWLNTYITVPDFDAWPRLISAACALVLWLFRRRLTSKLVAFTWVLAASLSALMGLLQYFGLRSIFSAWIFSSSVGEAYANLRQRNLFATLTSIGLVALIAWLAMREKSNSDPAAWRTPWWASALAILLALGNAASSSRTGLLQWLLIPLLTAWWTLPRRRDLLGLALQALLAYGIAVFTLPWLLELITGTHSDGLFGRLSTDVGCFSRKVLWSNVLTLISQKPWFGWGWGELEYAHFITPYPGARFCQLLDNAHNLPLHLAVELGVPTALSICGILCWLVWQAKPWRDTDPARQMAWGVLTVIGLHSLLEYPLWYGPFQLAVGLCVGLLWVRSAQGQACKFMPVSPAMGYLRVLAPIVMAGMLVAIAISYYGVSQIYLPPAERSAAYREDTLYKIRRNWFFSSQARHAELSMTTLTPDTAANVYAMARKAVHYSAESSVVEKLIGSAAMLGREDEAVIYLMRYQAAFPDRADWVREQLARRASQTEPQPTK